MVRVAGVVEKNTLIYPPNVITVAAATATQIFDVINPRQEYVARYIQNVGANRAYYSWGITNVAGAPVCNNIDMFHGYIEAGQQLDCSAHGWNVNVYSVAGTTISTTVVIRNDLGARN